MAKTVKVRIETTVEIDVESWTLQFGDMTLAEVREDVRTYCDGIIEAQLDRIDALAKKKEA